MSAHEAHIPSREEVIAIVTRPIPRRLATLGVALAVIGFAIFLPFTLTTRLRIEGMALIMVLTAGAIIISAGMKTALGGGGSTAIDDRGKYL